MVSPPIIFSNGETYGTEFRLTGTDIFLYSAIGKISRFVHEMYNVWCCCGHLCLQGTTFRRGLVLMFLNNQFSSTILTSIHRNSLIQLEHLGQETHILTFNMLLMFKSRSIIYKNGTNQIYYVYSKIFYQSFLYTIEVIYFPQRRSNWICLSVEDQTRSAYDYVLYSLLIK